MGSSQDLATLFRRELEQAKGYQSDMLATNRQSALDYYNGKMPAAPEGRAQDVSMDVADAVHSLLAQVQPVLKTTQIEFEPKGQDDETQAQAESDFVRIMLERAGGFEVVFAAAHDAFLLRNGWVYTGVQEEKIVTEDRYPPDMTEDQIAAILQLYPQDREIKVTQSKSYTRFKVTETKRTLVVESVRPEDMFYSETGECADIEKVRFVCRQRLYTVSALRELGISQATLDQIPDATLGTEYNARQGQQKDEGSQQPDDAAEKLKRIYCGYMRVSKGNSSKSELRHVWLGGAEIIKDEPAKYVPFVTGSAVPVPHRINGMSVYDLLQSIQAGKTQILRQYMDNLSVMNASRTGAVDGQVNMDDLTNGRINGVVRVRNRDALFALPATDIGPQAMAGLNYLDQVRTARIGSAMDFNDVQAQLMSSSATAAAGQLAKVEQMAGWFAQNIAQTILLPVFRNVHRILRTELAGPVSAKIGGKWAETDTSQWQPRDITNVSMGMTSVEKAERMQGLATVIQQITAMLQQGGGGIITDQSRLYNAMSDWIRTANLGAPDQYLIDPASPEAKQAAQARQQEQQQQQQTGLMIQKAAADLQHQYKLAEQAQEIQYKRWSDVIDAQLKEAELTLRGVIDTKRMRQDLVVTLANANKAAGNGATSTNA